jgi:NAD+ diphosphatase
MRPKQEFGGAPLYFCVRDDALLVAGGDASIALPAEPPAGQELVLGSLGDRACVAVDCNDRPPPELLRAVGLRELYGLFRAECWAIASVAVQIVVWDRQHRFCGRCATATERRTYERSRYCPNCGLSAYPRITPAIIVLVTRGEHEELALLAWGRRARGRHYSTLAGFVEPGEELEQTVRREVFEETAIEVTGIQYFGSQPWPFPHQLMLGFRARWAAGEIRVQESELVEARWFLPDEVDQVTASRGDFSIAGRLIDAWIAEQRSGHGSG